jgi:hypothetical protein
VIKKFIVRNIPMLQMCRFSILLSLLSLPSLGIAASVTASLQFVPADPGRTHMDRGGTWNGTAEVTATTGDTFRATFQNAAGSGSAFDFAAKLNIMPNFALVPSTVTATVSGAGCGSAPGVSGTRVGNDIVISFSPSGYDLPDDCELTIDYGVYATGATTIGQKTIKSLYQYANVDGGSLVSEKNAKVDVEVLNGISTITKTPAIQDKAVGDTAAWTVEVCNSGFGGLFDVQIDESAMNPNPAGSLQATTMTQSAPAVPAATLTAPFVKTLPYLAPAIRRRLKRL